MRKTLHVVTVAIVLALFGSGFLGKSPRAADQTRPAVQQWEYKVAYLAAGAKNGATDEEKVERLQSQLNDQGKDGWELVQVHFVSTAIFKRPAQE